MPGFANGVMYADNVRFDGTDYPGQVTTNGQLLIGSTAAPNVRVGTLTAGTGISIVNGAGSITINGVGGSVTWSTISANQTLVVNHGYICISPGGALTLALPATSAVGDVIEITLDGATSWSISQAASQQIRIGSSATTAGVGGSLTSTAQGDSIKMVCRTANLLWQIVSSIGNPTVV